MAETERAASENAGEGSVTVAELLKLLMEKRKLRAQEEQRQADREQIEREAERKRKEDEERRRSEQERLTRDEWRKQLEVLTCLAEGRNRESEYAGRILREGKAKVAKLSDKDDIEAYLATFERTMVAYEVSKLRWVYKQLSGKAQQAYAALPSDEAKEYDQLKDAILRRYDIICINEETYRQLFRVAMKSSEESNRELAVRVKYLAAKWLKQQTTVDDVIEAISYSTPYKRMFGSGCENEHVRRRVSSRTTRSGEEAGRRGLKERGLQKRRLG